MAWILDPKRKTITKRHTIDSFAREVVPRYIARGYWTKSEASKFVAAARARIKKDPRLAGYNTPPKGMRVIKKLPKNIKGWTIKR